MVNQKLKTLALRAKNRLLNRGIDSPIFDKRIKIIDNDDSAFVEKVRELLNKDADIINPLKLLMDEKIIATLDENGKERYLLQTMDKYLKAKKQIENESIAS